MKRLEETIVVKNRLHAMVEAALNEAYEEVIVEEKFGESGFIKEVKYMCYTKEY